MTREDIIRMAREAGGYLAELPNGEAWLFDEDEQIARFAALVAAAERERLLAAVEMPETDTHCFDTDTNQDVWSHSKEQLREAVYVAVNATQRAFEETCVISSKRGAECDALKETNDAQAHALKTLNECLDDYKDKHQEQELEIERLKAAAAQPAQVSEYECRKLLYGFMLDCNAVGLEQAGKNLHRSMKEKNT